MFEEDLCVICNGFVSDSGFIKNTDVIGLDYLYWNGRKICISCNELGKKYAMNALRYKHFAQMYRDKMNAEMQKWKKEANIKMIKIDRG